MTRAMRLLAATIFVLAAPRLLSAQERGAVALGEAVAGLDVTGRVLLIGAHPDDEDTQLLTWLARGQSVETAYLPLTLAVAQTVLVRAGGRVWALPSPMVEQVQQIKDKDLINLYLTREVAWQNRKYPFFYLPRLLGNAGHQPETTRYNSVLLLKSGQNLTAVARRGRPGHGPARIAGAQSR